MKVIDLATHTVIGAFRVGLFPNRIALDPDERFAYVAGLPTVQIDLATGDTTALADAFFSEDVALSPDGRAVYIAVAGTGGLDIGLLVIDSRDDGSTKSAAPEYDGSALAVAPDGRFIFLGGNRPGTAEERLLVLDAGTMQVVADVGFDGGISPTSIVVAPDSSTLYLVARGREIYVADAASGDLRHKILDAAGAVTRLALSPDGRTLYASHLDKGLLTVIDTTTNDVVATLPVGTRPQAVAASADGQSLYVAAADGVHRIDTGTHVLHDWLPAAVGPAGLATSADGRLVYVAGHVSGSIAIVDTEQGAVTRGIATGGNPIGIVLTPDETRAYVANLHVPGSIFVVDTINDLVTHTIETQAEIAAIAMTPDGQRVLVANYDFGTILVIDVKTNAVQRQIHVGAYPRGIAISANGLTGVIGTETPSALQILSFAQQPPLITATVRLTPSAASEPCGVAVSRDGQRAYVTQHGGGAVNFVDTRTKRIAATTIALPYSTEACGIALPPDERRVYVANTLNNVVSVLDAGDLHVLHHIPVLPRPYGVAIGCPGGCPTPVATATPTVTTTVVPTTTSTRTMTTTAAPTSTRRACHGDCNGDGVVAIDDLVRAVRIALGGSLETCASLDLNGDQQVTIAELVHAVQNGLNDCGG